MGQEFIIIELQTRGLKQEETHMFKESVFKIFKYKSGYFSHRYRLYSPLVAFF